MNAFILDTNLIKNAEYHCDAHVVKLILESAQMASNAYSLTSVAGQRGPYKLTNVNHPISKWTRANISNYRWMCYYGLALCKEYTFRYDKIHVAQQKLFDLLTDTDYLNLPDLPLQPPHQSVPKELQRENTWEGAVQAYRDYYNKVKRFTMKTGVNWRHKRKEPDWYANFQVDDAIAVSAA